MVVRSPPIRRSSENYPFDSRGDCLLAASSQRPPDDYWQNLRLALLPWYEIPATNSHYVCITSSSAYSWCIPPSHFSYPDAQFFSSTVQFVFPRFIIEMCAIAWFRVAPCQCHVPAGIVTTSPTETTLFSLSVATIP